MRLSRSPMIAAEPRSLIALSMRSMSPIGCGQVLPDFRGICTDFINVYGAPRHRLFVDQIYVNRFVTRLKKSANEAMSRWVPPSALLSRMNDDSKKPLSITITGKLTIAHDEWERL